LDFLFFFPEVILEIGSAAYTRVFNNKLTAQAENYVPKIFPVYSPNNKGPNFPLYCQYQLLKYKPWQRTHENVWEDKPGTDKIYRSKWRQFLKTSYAKEHVPDWHDKDTEHATQELPQREE